jgi:Domain of unknown function (DUF5069)
MFAPRDESKSDAHLRLPVLHAHAKAKRLPANEHDIEGIAYGMATITALDLRKAPPRSGKETLGRYAWLARLADKARAENAATNGDYVAYCPMSMGFLRRAGVSKDEFDRLIKQGATDEQLIKYFDEHVSDEKRESANRFIIDEHREAVEKQDAEEGHQ